MYVCIYCLYINILNTRDQNGQFEIGGGMSFESLSELIDYYKDNPMVEAKPSGNVVHLKQVCVGGGGGGSSGDGDIGNSCGRGGSGGSGSGSGYLIFTQCCTS